MGELVMDRQDVIAMTACALATLASLFISLPGAA
jgi:hypothetical protein